MGIYLKKRNRSEYLPRTIHLSDSDSGIDLSTSQKRGLDRAPKSGKMMEENKRMTPVLDINPVSCGKKIASDHRTFFRGLYDKFTQSELAMAQLHRGKCYWSLLLCFSLFSFIVS